MEISAWRAERDARGFLEKPIPTVPPLKPGVPEEMPGLWKKFDVPQPPNIEAYIDPPPTSWSGDLQRNMQWLISGGVMSLVQLLQLALLLLLAWFLVRQLGRRPSATTPTPAPGGQTEDLSRRPPEQNF
jgi:hypothetical protein